jgi:hypothetical protein
VAFSIFAASLPDSPVADAWTKKAKNFLVGGE